MLVYAVNASRDFLFLMERGWEYCDTWFNDYLEVDVEQIIKILLIIHSYQGLINIPQISDIKISEI